mgnify:CR=1 FL=1
MQGEARATEPRGRKSEKDKKGDRVKGDITDQVKTKTKTRADVVKCLEVDESEIAGSIKSRSESGAIDSIKMFDLEEPNLWAKRTKRAAELDTNTEESAS